MIVHVFACDYDGTIAEHGRVSSATATALERVRQSGRKLVLVTGRMLPDLREVCPAADEMFDAIVAENGALLYLPATREVKVLADAPAPALVQALHRRQVDLVLGTSIVATTESFAEASLAAIREAGEERALIFNKGALMLLPAGVTKQTGLEAALLRMGLSRHNTVGIGDAENDHAFLSMCECAVAVADAIPALRQRADHVTRAPSAQGVIEFVEEHLLEDLASLLPRLRRHALSLGLAADQEPMTIGAHATNLAVVGPSASGKSTLTGVLVERLVEAERSVCLLDPEGDYQTLGELPRVVVLGGKGEHALPSPTELEQLLSQPGDSLVLNLSAMTSAEKVDYATKALAVVATLRSTRGLPHWLVIDEAHHLLPTDGPQAAELLPPFGGPLALTTLGLDCLARALWPRLNAVASTERAAFQAALHALGLEQGDRTGGRLPPPEPIERGEALLARLDGPRPRAVRFTVARRRVEHRRHLRKYAEGELPADRSFFFRGPRGELNLRAANLVRFVELAEGVDEATWMHHLRRGDYSSWLRSMIKDPELADQVIAVERDGTRSADASRGAVIAAIRGRYTI